jgi:hypothetical protein
MKSMDGQKSSAHKGDAPEQKIFRDASTEGPRPIEPRSNKLFEAWRKKTSGAERASLHDDWRERLRAIATNHVNDIADEIASEYERRVSTGKPQPNEEARREEARLAAQAATETLNAAVYKIRNAATRLEWLRAVVAGARQFAPRVALLTLKNSEAPLHDAQLVLEIDSGSALPSELIPLCYAPAFLSALESGEPVTAMRSGAEISVALENMLGPGGNRVQALPIVSRGAAFALIYTEDPIDGNALNVIATVAGLSAETKREFTRQVTYELPATSNASPRPSSWNDIPRGDQELHLRAQRFARTQAAQLRLYQAEQVREGREAADLYGVLRGAIDGARQSYQDQFVIGCESMVDYLHAELVKTLANNDARLMGGAYPGPLR